MGGALLWRNYETQRQYLLRPMQALPINQLSLFCFYQFPDTATNCLHGFFSLIVAQNTLVV